MDRIKHLLFIYQSPDKPRAKRTKKLRVLGTQGAAAVKKRRKKLAGSEN